MKKIIISDHALFQMHRRGILEKDVRKIIRHPEQTKEIRPGRLVFQCRIMAGAPPKAFLVRVFVDGEQGKPRCRDGLSHQQN